MGHELSNANLVGLADLTATNNLSRSHRPQTHCLVGHDGPGTALSAAVPSCETAWRIASGVLSLVLLPPGNGEGGMVPGSVAKDDLQLCRCLVRGGYGPLLRHTAKQLAPSGVPNPGADADRAGRGGNAQRTAPGCLVFYVVNHDERTGEETDEPPVEPVGLDLDVRRSRRGS